MGDEVRLSQEEFLEKLRCASDAQVRFPLEAEERKDILLVVIEPDKVPGPFLAPRISEFNSDEAFRRFVDEICTLTEKPAGWTTIRVLRKNDDTKT